MKYLRQLSILFACCIVGDVLSLLTKGHLPGNVIGMVLLFVFLCFKLLKPQHVENIADFFLQNMAFFFLPACVSLIDVFPTIRAKLLPILFVIVVTTLLTASATAFTVHWVLKWQASLKGQPHHETSH